MSDNNSRTSASEFARTYTSFSGCDIVCTFGDTVIGELQAITYDVRREKAPIYTMGSAEPRSFSRGKRGVSGSLVFTVFDRDALISGLQNHIKDQQTFQRIGKDTNMEVIDITEWDSKMTDMGTKSVSGATAKSADTITKNLAQKTVPVYADEIPPFDITISFANEYGQNARLVIYGVEILSEATGFSIDNVTSEKACSFVARRVEYMRPVNSSTSDGTATASGDGSLTGAGTDKG